MGSIFSSLLLPPGHPRRKPFNFMRLVKKLIAFALMFFGASGVTNFFSYLLPLLYTRLAKEHNFIERYASLDENQNKRELWAVVTGASTGLGKAIARSLASRGFNIVLVALDQQVLHDTYQELSSEFQRLSFRAVGCNLGPFGVGAQEAQGAPSDHQVEIDNGYYKVPRGADYMPTLQSATSDITVAMVFNNAGYIKMGTYDSVPIKPQLDNVECQVIGPMRITDLFYKRMIRENRKGAICFTSSPGGFFPSPLGTSYPGSKAYLSSFASALACEASHHNIDVCCMHPSFIRGSGFCKDLPKMKLWEQLSAIGQSPETITKNFLQSIGRVTLCDSGMYSIGQRLLLKIMSTEVWTRFVSYSIARTSDTQALMTKSSKSPLPLLMQSNPIHQTIQLVK